MKTNHQFCTAFLAVTVLTLLVSGLAHADNIYVSCSRSGTIEKYDSSGNESLFDSGWNSPVFIATQVPEPATLLLLGFGAVMLRRKN